jgi:hypothetical protein
MKTPRKIVFYNPEKPNTDYDFWMSKSPEERIYALERLRNQYLTDQNGIRQRLQRVLSITKPTRS